MSPVLLSKVTLSKAPPLSGEQWVNSPPLGPESLRRRPVVVLFWTTSCEASWVRLRQLEALRSRHGDRLGVVAVHSPRFDYERDVNLLTATIAHRGLSVPVLHDPGLETWARYGPTGRPTVVVVNSNQRVLGAMVGTDESSLVALDEIAAQQVLLADRSTEPLPDLLPVPGATSLERLHGPAGLTRLTNGCIALIDRGNNRLVTLDLDAVAQKATVRDVFGGMHSLGSIATRSDGTISISSPDRGVVESIDLATKKRDAIATGLVRPMGLVEDVDGSLVVCDAGADQLIRVAAETTGPIANAISQPLDVIRIDAGLLFSEASTGALRLLSHDGRVRTVNAGTRPGLLDGPAHKAMFQRPSGLATLDNDRVAIVDHGNSRIRIMADRRVTTVPVSGLSHPEAMLYLGNEQLLCCDTMNNRLVIIDLASHTACEVTVSGLPL